jgi:hypothetical protein
MTATSSAITQNTEDDFALARASLQEITESAVSDRELRPFLAAEMFVPAVHLAQQIAEKLHDYGLGQEAVIVGEGEDARTYLIRHVSWENGTFGRRERHQAQVLIRRLGSDRVYRLLWDPRSPDRSYDLTNPPSIYFPEFKYDPQGESFGLARHFHMHTLAGQEVLAQWAKDALSLLEQVRTRECERTAHLRDGLDASASALDVLDL